MIAGSFLSLRGHILVRIVGGHSLIGKKQPVSCLGVQHGQGEASDETGSEEVI